MNVTTGEDLLSDPDGYRRATAVHAALMEMGYPEVALGLKRNDGGEVMVGIDVDEVPLAVTWQVFFVVQSEVLEACWPCFEADVEFPFFDGCDHDWRHDPSLRPSREELRRVSG